MSVVFRVRTQIYKNITKTKNLALLCNMSYEQAILDDLEKHETSIPDDPLFILERIKKYDFGYLYHKSGGIRSQYDTEYYTYKKFIDQLYDQYLNRYYQLMEGHEDYFSLKRQIADFACSFNLKKYDILVSIKDHDKLMEDARETLQTDIDETVNYESIIGLAQCYEVEEAQYKIGQFFKHAFKESREYALRTREYDYLGDNLNGDIYTALTQGISYLPSSARKELQESVFEAYAFLSDHERSYACHQASGYMSLYLPNFEQKIDPEIINSAIDETGKHYPENKFVHQTLYTKWILENNGRDALRYLQDEDNKEWPTYAIIALTDLNYKDALPAIKKLHETNTDPIVHEVLEESIMRLSNQKTVPELSERMIWMNGVMSPTYRALTGENDNQFVARSKKKQEVDDSVYETDDE